MISAHFPATQNADLGCLNDTLQLLCERPQVGGGQLIVLERGVEAQMFCKESNVSPFLSQSYWPSSEGLLGFFCKHPPKHKAAPQLPEGAPGGQCISRPDSPNPDRTTGAASSRSAPTSQLGNLVMLDPDLYRRDKPRK